MTTPFWWHDTPDSRRVDSELAMANLMVATPHKQYDTTFTHWTTNTNFGSLLQNWSKYFKVFFHCVLTCKAARDLPLLFSLFLLALCRDGRLE